jgi:hypothetical protein
LHIQVSKDSDYAELGASSSPICRYKKLPSSNNNVDKPKPKHISIIIFWYPVAKEIKD